jgi:hypothetical protein
MASLATGVAVVAIAVAPAASADPGAAPQSCSDTGPSATICESPGNVQLNDTPPPFDGPTEFPWFVGGFDGDGGMHGFGGGGMHGFGGGHR